MLDTLILLNQWVWSIVGLIVGIPILLGMVVTIITSICTIIYAIFAGIKKCM